MENLKIFFKMNKFNFFASTVFQFSKLVKNVPLN